MNEHFTSPRSGIGRHAIAAVAYVLAAGAACTAFAADAQADKSAFPVKPYAEMRYRLETVDQDGIARDALASTLRTRLGLRSIDWQGFSAVLEGQWIAHTGDDHFNDSVNGRTRYPLVIDPKSLTLNQAFLRWHWKSELEVTAGRQSVNVDNQRWIGAVDWRQNGQTLDSAAVSYTPVAGTTVSYRYVWRVNRIYGPASPQGAYRDTSIHLVHLTQTLGKYGSLMAYDYLVDIPVAPAASSRTLGARFSGSPALGSSKTKLLYAVEYARQSDYGLNPRRFNLDYWLFEPGIAVGPASLRLGYERLEGNGTVALQTPLATLHAFNGWADKFLTTPVNGLRDIYGDASWKLSGPGVLKDTNLRVAYHMYESVHTSVDYGREWDLLVSHPLGQHFSALLKYARYSADHFATDTSKFWFAIDAKF